MAVRFLPPPEERSKPDREDNSNLAEVIEFRSQVRRPEPQLAWLKPGENSEPTLEGRSSAEPVDAPEQAPAPALALVGTTEAAALLARAQLAAQKRGETRPDGGDDYANDRDGGGHDGIGLRDGDRGDDQADDGPTAREHAVKLLARKALTSGELQRGLLDAGYTALDAEIAVAECVEALYLNDMDVAHAVAQKLRDSKGESKGRIRQKLRERMLPDEAIDAALEELDDDEELELLRQTAADRARRLADLDRQTAERRLLGFLARRGWSGERASRAAREALDAVMRSGGGPVRFR